MSEPIIDAIDDALAEYEASHRAGILEDFSRAIGLTPKPWQVGLLEWFEEDE